MTLTWYFPDTYGPGTRMWVPDYIVILVRQRADNGDERAARWLAALCREEPVPEPATGSLGQACHEAYLRSRRLAP